MANWFAYFMLFSWPVVVAFFVNKYSLKKAILWSIIGAVLFLPEMLSVDLPLLPPLNKSSVTTLTLFFTLMITGKSLKIFQSGWTNKLFIIYLLTLFISAELNNFPVYTGGAILPSISHYDALSTLIRFFIDFLPFIFGRRFLNDLNDNEYIFRVLTIVGLFYSVLMLFEIRMSPQLHNWIYGYTPAQFIQNMRAGGFRPIVFLGGGLPLAFMFSTFLLAAFALLKNNVRVVRFSPLLVVCYMSVVLVLCKTWSPIAYAFIGMILIFKTRPKTQIKFAWAMALFAFFFPIFRTMDLIPTQAMVEFVADFDIERAQSLGFRFDNEDALLHRAMERPFFGWGGWGRNRIFDSSTGQDISVTDGKWIIELGANGLMGFISYFGLLILPIFYSLKVIDKIGEYRQKVWIATQTLILAFCVIDLLPNANMGAIHLLLAGSLLGQAEQIRRLQFQKKPQPIAQTDVKYS
jgi:hypothetical protein